MNIVPAHVAGVKNIIMTTPPGKDGKVTANTLVAAKEAGATKVYLSLIHIYNPAALSSVKESVDAFPSSPAR